ncbi:MAG TPA: NHL repeat-containing protein [Pyrinomonadaceae bacterium]|jgi:hypothetical protein
MAQSLECNNCGAPVKFAGGYEVTVPCQFCGNSVVVPEELRSARPAQPPVFQFKFQPIPVYTPSIPKVSKGWLWLLLIPFFFIMCTISGIILPLLPKTGPAGRRTGGEWGKPASSGPASVTLKFGSEGIGPGRFQDARSIAVDTAGRIYVGEYTGGRIQVFDASGKFINQWSIGDRKTILRGMAADRKGNIYVVKGGSIYRYDGGTSEQLDQLEYAGGWGFDDVTVTADGGILAAWYKNRDDIVRFDAKGKAVSTIRAAISQASGDSELNTRLAADGLGNIYALGTFNNAVFKFAPDGKYLSRFGSAGDQPGQFRAPSAIAVDGRGRVYVSDSKGIQIFDQDGRYLDLIKKEGYTNAFGMVFNDRNELFVAARTQVVRLSIRQP